MEASVLVRGVRRRAGGGGPVTITASDIPIPSTAADYTPPVQPTDDEVRQHRAREARHQTSACPHCGEWAIVETVTAHRVGMPGVVQTISRCQRNPRWKQERCPLTILHEEWAEDTTAPVAEEEESMPERTCEKCGADIAHRGVRAKMCAPCAAAKKVERDREHNQRMSERRKSKRVVQTPPPQNVLHPVPSALRVSVLTLAQQATDNPGARALLRDVLALSSERQDLLRRLLDDVEAA
jgi:ribosomal protein L32